MQQPSLSPPLLFISDAHLGGFSKTENDRIESELVQLISYCQRNAIRMVILGDLFDYWMEYPDHTPRLGRQLLDRFEEFNRQFGPTLYITGNHDNWTRGHFEDRGFHVESEYFRLQLEDKKLLLLHGDGLKDPAFNLPRPVMHRVLRSSRFVRFFQRLLPAETGIELMKRFSRFNRQLGGKQNNYAILNRWSEQQLKVSGTDIIITGHDHKPRRKHFDFGSYINLGTFFHHRTAGYYNNSSIKVVSWKPETQSLQPFDSTAF